MSRTLTITPAPFKSSRLAIPPSPGSPRTPLTLSIRHSSPCNTIKAQCNPIDQVPPPSTPAPWLWQCHVCNRVYPLATTRCIDDGHRFCSGTTTIRKQKRTGKKIVKHQACASEFDYGGWRSYNEWRRSCLEAFGKRDSDTLPVSASDTRISSRSRDCWYYCDFPSECRWGKEIGLQKVQSTADLSSEAGGIKIRGSAQCLTLEDIPDQTLDMDQSAVTGDKIGITPFSIADVMPPCQDDLDLCEERRKRKSGGQLPSPLAPCSRTLLDRINALSNEDELKLAWDELEASLREPYL
ncbi:hypothetical protein AMS68_005298 [Peltaster fructicola]|uniref:Uncharacterized protein n=1 Tax=Peltaster fructicola TaxID=286661 RepID=A0A6H0XYP0_9PEZI|nr:hypothetical protein AMS68_005298 [Peltaster fructicola]